MTSSGEPGPIVDVAWIAAHERDPKVRLIELDVSPNAYETGHIPEAMLWNAYTDLRDTDHRPIEPEQLERLLSRSGVTPETTLVFYGYGAALGLWLMNAYGHNDVRMLVGSREQWAQADGQWSTDVPEWSDIAALTIVTFEQALSAKFLASTGPNLTWGSTAMTWPPGPTSLLATTVK